MEELSKRMWPNCQYLPHWWLGLLTQGTHTLCGRETIVGKHSSEHLLHFATNSHICTHMQHTHTYTHTTHTQIHTPHKHTHTTHTHATNTHTYTQHVYFRVHICQHLYHRYWAKLCANVFTM